MNEFGEGSSKTQNTSSSDDMEFSKLCDDNSDDDIDDGGETCLICEERGKDEISYRFVVFGFTQSAVVQILQKTMSVTYALVN